MNDTTPIYKLIFRNSLNYFSLKYREFWSGGRILKSLLRESFKKRKVSIIIDITGSPQSNSVFILNQADDIIGFNKIVCKSLYIINYSIDNITHILDFYAKVVKCFIEIEINILLQRSKIESEKAGVILVHPFAPWSVKEWDIQKFISPVKKINTFKVTKFIMPVNFVSQNIEAEIDLSGPESSIIETRTINELNDNLKNVFLILVNDTDVICVQNLLSKPTFNLFGRQILLFLLYLQKTLILLTKLFTAL